MKFCFSSETIHSKEASRPARGAWVEILLLWIGSEIRLSRPARGAWVEIFPMGERFAALTWSRPARGAWVEIPKPEKARDRAGSRPARGAWVEIELPDEVIDAMLVAPRKGRVG